MPNTVPSTAASNAAPQLAHKQLHIAVGVIRDSQGQILISRRRAGTAGAGLWEFPGGKREAGESIRAALDRELAEELGIEVLDARPLICIRHAYPDRQVLLDTWMVGAWQGEAHGREGQLLNWVAPDALPDTELLPANGPITTAARLPDSYLITPEVTGDRAQFLRSLQRSLEAGVSLLRLRSPGLTDADYQALAADVQPLCQTAGAKLLLDRSVSLVQASGTGLHLDSQRLMALDKRPDVAGWLAASCHDAQQLARAEALGCDFAVLGQVAETASHAGMPTLGWKQAASLIDAANIPVYCIGGMRKEDRPQAHACGAQGIAAIRGLWGV